MDLFVLEFGKVIILALLVLIAERNDAQHCLVFRNAAETLDQLFGRLATIDMTPARTKPLLFCRQQDMLCGNRPIRHPGVTQARVQRYNDTRRRRVEHLTSVRPATRHRTQFGFVTHHDELPRIGPLRTRCHQRTTQHIIYFLLLHRLSRVLTYRPPVSA